MAANDYSTMTETTKVWEHCAVPVALIAGTDPGASMAETLCVKIDGKEAFSFCADPDQTAGGGYSDLLEKIHRLFEKAAKRAVKKYFLWPEGFEYMQKPMIDRTVRTFDALKKLLPDTHLEKFLTAYTWEELPPVDEIMNGAAYDVTDDNSVTLAAVCHAVRKIVAHDYLKNPNVFSACPLVALLEPSWEREQPSLFGDNWEIKHDGPLSTQSPITLFHIKTGAMWTGSISALLKIAPADSSDNFLKGKWKGDEQTKLDGIIELFLSIDKSKLKLKKIPLITLSEVSARIKSHINNKNNG